MSTKKGSEGADEEKCIFDKMAGERKKVLGCWSRAPSTIYGDEEGYMVLDESVGMPEDMGWWLK